MQAEGEHHQGQDGQAAVEQAAVRDGGGGRLDQAVEIDAAPQVLAEEQTDEPDQHHQQDQAQRQRVDQEVVEGQVRPAGHDDVGRVGDQRRGAADVGGQDERDQVGHRAQPQPLADRQRHRRDQQHRGHVVEDRRERRGDQDQQRRQAGRSATGLLDRPQGEELEQARLLEDADDHHHPEEQEDDVPVDPGLMTEEGRLGIDDPERHHRGDATQGGGDAVDTLGGDEAVGDDEDGHRCVHDHALSSMLSTLRDRRPDPNGCCHP